MPNTKQLMHSGLNFIESTKPFVTEQRVFDFDTVIYDTVIIKTFNFSIYPTWYAYRYIADDFY